MMFAAFKSVSGVEGRIVASKVTGISDATVDSSKPKCKVYLMSSEEPFFVQGTCEEIEKVLVAAMAREYASQAQIRKAVDR